jgi:predicted amidohydrolase YtcJ
MQLRLLIALLHIAAVAVTCAGAQEAARPASTPAPAAPDLIVYNAKVTTQDEAKAEATAVAVAGEIVVAVGNDAETLKLRTPSTKIIDAGGRRIIPGLNDSHLHVTREGRFYNTELRWDGVTSLTRGLTMIREQAARTPAGQWVRVVGGWSPQQFAERRMPTVAELNEAAPQTPTFVMFLYSQGMLNRAGVEALGITAQTKAPPGCRYELLPGGGAILHAEPSPVILYQTIDALPKLSAEDQVNSTRHWYRELNRFGLTSAVDPGGGGHLFPDDYAATKVMADEGHIPLRISLYLFAQKPGAESDAYRQWTREQRLALNMATARLNGYVASGAGENLVATAADYENFLADRVELKPAMEADLKRATSILARAGWPIRIHATYDESVTRMLNVFEPVFRESNYKSRWAFDHVETLSDANLARIKALGGGVAVQDRMGFAGETFVDRYGAAAAATAPPLRKLMDSGIPLGAGTDGTRVSSYNPWISLYWMTTGKTVGGTQQSTGHNLLTRAEALGLYTVGSAWFSGDEQRKGRLAPGQFADFAVLSEDYFEVDAERIKAIESVLTIVGGDVVYAAGEFDRDGIAPSPLPPVSPAWSPVATYGGYQRPQ